ncbi:MAG: hypothetical protein Q8Q09_23000 [Deltaproteobacteria bacterium]|nr:hypothetical protein [Deltaproteobacteria bacterium]
MKYSRRHTARLSLPMFSMLSGLAAVQCAPTGPNEPQDPDSLDVSELRFGSNSDSNKWIYNGLLPALVEPSIVVSIPGHTARVSGYLPQGFTGPLPFYTSTADDRGRRRLTVVYPIATGATTDAPGVYPDIRAIGYLPYARNSAGSYVPWGGFPFLEYNHRRGIAFHGPITHGVTATGIEWLLKRGPVSHGCNRMQGEHVVELAHLLGLRMNEPQRAGAASSIRVDVRVIEAYDTVDGQSVDVRYPRTAGAVAPTGAVRMFNTWNSNDFPRWVCAYKTTRAVDANHCAYEPANRLDPVTGAEPADAPSVLVDNRTEGAFATTGPWEISSARPGFIATDYAALGAGAVGEAVFTLPTRALGARTIMARYIAHTNRNTTVRYEIRRSATDSAPVFVTVNQREGDGWAALGMHTLAAGATVRVRVPAGSDGYTIVDALRLDR